MPEYIARISYGKDSLKMLDVIFTRDLPLDRITTTDVWATDTISANLPPMEEFKARMDERIWNLYRVDVEHLCARNKDGSKKTYEQMFYHVPVRRSQSVQVERERERESRPPAGLDLRIPNSLAQMVSNCPQKICRSTGYLDQSRAFLGFARSTGARNSNSCRRQGFPAQISPWCRKLKIDNVRTAPSPPSAPRGARKEISWNIWESLRTSLHGLAS